MTDTLQAANKSPFCLSGHPVTDRDEYEKRCTGIRSWGHVEGRLKGLDLGECRLCGSSISYPARPKVAQA